jgi:hypothetical protein
MNQAQKIIAWLFISGSVILVLSRLSSEAKAGSEAYGPILYRDILTGCEYLSSSHDSALTPRISADGKTHLGCKKGAQ